jgi:hypothetical protein
VRAGIAALSTSTGAATAWNPTPNGTVNALALSGSLVYAGGAFTNIGGQTRNRLAALNTTTGAANAFNPNADGNVSTVLVGPTEIYAGGAFHNLGGQPRSHLGAVNISGMATGWIAGAVNSISAMQFAGQVFYFGGNFATVAGEPQSYIARSAPLALVAVDGPPVPPAFSIALRPNPTSTGVYVEYTLPQAAHVRLGIYDVGGREVASPVNELEEPGPHSVHWAGDTAHGRLRSGVYFVRLDADERRAASRLVIVR